MKSDKVVTCEIERWSKASGKDCAKKGYKGRPVCGGSVTVECS